MAPNALHRAAPGHSNASRRGSSDEAAMANGQTTVLVVDDEPEIAELMRDFLQADGFAVAIAHDGPAALAALDRTAADCVLLDIMMPGQSGFDTLRQMRERSAVPVLILSARDADVDKIRGLGLGTDDDIVKSATPAEVVARIKAVLRRAGTATAPARLDFGRLVIDPAAREVWVDGEPVALTAREFDLLRLLAEHPRRVFTRDELYERLWGEYGDRHTVTVHIGRIREKIEATPSQPALLRTVWGVGYRFEGTPQGTSR
jgi:DNA-binding response OmpR family regulator